MAVTGRDGTITMEAPLGLVHVTVGSRSEEAWIGVDVATEVEIEC